MKLTPVIIFLFFAILNSPAQSKKEQIDSLYTVLETVSKEDRTENLLLLGKTYLSINLDSSVAIYNAIYDQSIKDRDKKVEGKSLIGLGTAYTKLSLRDSAQMYFKTAEKTIQGIQDYDLETGLWMNQGILYVHLSEYEKARAEFEKVLASALEVKNNEDISRCYNNIAVCNGYLGDYEGALKMHMKSAEMAKDLEDPISLAKSYNNMGLIYFDLDDYAKSEEYLLKSLEIKKEQGAEVSVVGSYLNLGNVFRKLGVNNKDSITLNKAKKYYTEALKLGEKTSYQKGINIAYSNLALVETSLGNFDKGVEYGKLAVQKNMELNDVISEVTSRVNLADAYRYKKQFQLAEEEIKKGMKLARETQNKFIEKEALFILSLVKSDNGDYKNGLKYYQEYSRLEDSISSTEIKNRVNELETKYQVAENERSLAETRANLAESELKVKVRNNVIYGSLALAFVLGLIGYLVFSQQKLKNRQLQKEAELRTALAKIETQNKLQEQRLRISRDLHDNIGAQLTFVTSSVDNLKFGLKGTNEAIGKKLTHISTFTTQTIFELRDTIWAMNKSEITSEDLQTRIANFIEKAGSARDEVDFSFNVAEDVSENNVFTSVQGMNIYRIIQEAVNNALKYAQASQITVSFSKNNGVFNVEIRDNGKGFNLQEVELGNGLENIKKRARDLGGKAVVHSEEGKGTTVALTF